MTDERRSASDDVGGGSPLMLVSADAGPPMRAAVRAGQRPCPDYLRLESAHDVELLDWSALPGGPHSRSVRLSARHVAASLRQVRTAPAVLTDGEHLGIVMASAMRARGIRTPHVMLGHRLLSARKVRAFRALGVGRNVDRILVHSRRQAELLPATLGVPPAGVHYVPYGVDTRFWAPGPTEESDLVFAAGREHRDFRLLATALADESVRVVITDHSPHSPRAARAGVAEWPANLRRQSFDFGGLRDMYARASVVVVPLVATDFPAGITGALEAMAMGKAVVATATPDMTEVIDNGTTGVLVPAGDVDALRRAIRSLLDDPAERQRLGDNGRRTVLARYSLATYAAAVADHLGVSANLGIRSAETQEFPACAF